MCNKHYLYHSTRNKIILSKSIHCYLLDVVYKNKIFPLAFIEFIFLRTEYAQLNKIHNLLQKIKLYATCQSHKNTETKNRK